MQKDKAHSRRLQWLLPVAAVALVVLMMQFFLGRMSGQLRILVPVDGVLDITGVDLSREVINVENNWSFYPNALYTSEDFASERAAAIPEDGGNPQYGTYRLVIRALPEQYYSLCS